MATRRSTIAPRASDVLLGLLVMLAGVLALVGTWLKVIPSVTALSTLVVVIGLLSLIAALVGRTSPGFFAEVVSGASLLVLGVLGLRTPADDLNIVFVVAGALFGVEGLVKMASASEFPWLRVVLLVCGAASVGLSAAVLSDALTPTLLSLAVVVGVQLLADGFTALAIGRERHAR